MNFSQAVKSALIEKYSTFSGRASRAESVSYTHLTLPTILLV